jgi:hypothetical protein
VTRRGDAASLTPGILAGALAGVLALGGCAPTAPTAATSAIAPSASPVASTITLAPSRSAGAIEVDQALLGVLPDEIEGQPLLPDDETAAGIVGLPAEVEAIAVGLYIQPGSSSGDDFAIVNVVRLRPGVFADAWFRSWRSTYDGGACQVAGGVAPGSAVSQIGDHETHIGSCQGGVHTYHVYLTSPDRVISITALGEGRFGERVVEGLTE